MAINLLLVDDHVLLRAGLSQVLNEFQDLKVVAEAASQAEVEAAFEHAPKPDVVLMDIGLGEDVSGIQITGWLTEHYPHVRVIGLTVSDEQSDIIELVQAGAKGYILKNTDPNELERAIKVVYAGGTYFASKVAESMLKRFMSGESDGLHPDDIPMRQLPNADVTLTPREIDILVLVAKEYSTAQISDKLNISPRTVENHRYRLTQKLGVKGAAGLAKYALKNGYLRSNDD